MPKEVNAKGDGVITREITMSINLTQQFRCPQNATNQPKSTVELGYMYPRGPPWSKDVCVFCYLSISIFPIWNTIQYMYKTKIHSASSSSNLCTLILEVHVWIKARVAQSVESIRLKISMLWGRVPLWATIFHFVICRFRRAPGRSDWSHTDEIKHGILPR